MHQDSTEFAEKVVVTFAKTYIIGYLALLNIEANQVGYLLIMVFVDSLFGLLASWRVAEQLSIKRLMFGMTSKLALLIIPFLLAGFGLAFGINLVYLVKGFIYLLATNDLISVIGHCVTLKTGVRYKSIDLIERGISMLTHFLAEKALLFLTPKKDENKPDDHSPAE